METAESTRLRRWMIATGVLMALVALFQYFVLQDLIEAIHAREPYGPFDGWVSKPPPKKTAAEAYWKQSWILAGWWINGLLSWALLGAAWCPRRTLELLRERFAPASPLRFALGLAAAGLAGWLFDLARADSAPWMLIGFAGLLLAGSGLGLARTPSSAGRLAAGAASAALCAITFPALAAENPLLLNAVFREDAAFELLQAQLYAITALLWIQARRDSPLSARPLLLLAALAIAFVAGEEVSWGQRFIEFDTPKFWVNNQDETTIHNIPGIDHLFQYRLLLLAWGALSIFAAAVAPLRRELERWGVPLVPPIGWLAVAAGLLVHTAERRALFENTDEMQETFGALAAVCSAYALRYRRAGLLGDEAPR